MTNEQRERAQKIAREIAILAVEAMDIACDAGYERITVPDLLTTLRSKLSNDPPGGMGRARAFWHECEVN